MSDRSAYTRWEYPPKHQKPEPGLRCYLDECYGGWRVQDLATGDIFTVWGSFENRTRVYRDGDDALNLLDNDREVELLDVGSKRHQSHAVFAPGDVVKVLYPSKNGGKIGIVVKGSYRYRILQPHGGKTFYADADFLVKLPGKWELTQT